jgi:hypothetical protein
MTLTSLESIIAALNSADVRYLILGGLAVAAHGYGRLTIGVDLVVQLAEANVLNALNALGSLGYRPIVPVPAGDFANPAKRQQWLDEKNMVVFSLRSEQHPYTPIDLFVSEPFDFDIEFERALVGEVGPHRIARFVCLETLITMKQATGRAKDKEDIEQLKLIQAKIDDDQ